MNILCCFRSLTPNHLLECRHPVRRMNLRCWFMWRRRSHDVLVHNCVARPINVKTKDQPHDLTQDASDAGSAPMTPTKEMLSLALGSSATSGRTKIFRSTAAPRSVQRLRGLVSTCDSAPVHVEDLASKHHSSSPKKRKALRSASSSEQVSASHSKTARYSRSRQTCGGSAPVYCSSPSYRT